MSVSQISLGSALKMSDQDYILTRRQIDDVELVRLQNELTQSEQQQSPESLVTHQARAALAAFYVQHNEPRLARPLLESCTEGLETILGKFHHETLAAVTDLANLYATSEPPSLDLAEPRYSHAYTGYKLTYGFMSDKTIAVAIALGNLYVAESRPSLAEPYLAHAANGYERLYGPTSSECKTALRSLAECYAAQHRIRVAAEVYQFLIECLEASDGPVSPTLISTAHTLASLLRNNGRESEGERIYQWILQRQFGALERLSPPWRGKRVSMLVTESPPPSRSGNSMHMRTASYDYPNSSVQGWEGTQKRQSVRRTLSSHAPAVLTRTLHMDFVQLPTTLQYDNDTMWLLDTKPLRLTHFEDEQVANLTGYAILSHTWGPDEATFDEVRKSHFLADFKRWTKSRPRYSKIQRACARAQKDDIGYIWIDTCCINKNSSAELSEAINSVYRWYENAVVCYALLSDLPVHHTLDTSNIHTCRWFSRGWTLQKLIAPSKVAFFDCDWNLIGSKTQLAPLIAAEKGINAEVLLDASLRTSVSVARRFSWAARRQTTRVEDEAYSLLGLFDVNMPMLYGEGKNAFRRLQEEIIRQSTDHSIFAWQPRALCSLRHHGLLLAPRVKDFDNCHNLTWTADMNSDESFELTNSGLKIMLRVRESNDGLTAVLNCQDENSQDYIVLTMRKHGTTRGTGRMICELVRSEADHIFDRPAHGSEELFAYKELVILRNPTFARFGVQFSLESGLTILDSLPRLATPKQGMPYTYLYSSFPKTFVLGSILLNDDSTASETVHEADSHSMTLYYGQFLRQDECHETFHMVFGGSLASDPASLDTVDPLTETQTVAPSLVAVSMPVGRKDIEVIYLKATATMASGSPSNSMFDNEDGLVGLDPVWTIHIARVRGYAL